MRNPRDYSAGFTKKVFNGTTGKFIAGGAARNFWLKLLGGASAMQYDAFISGVEHVQPDLDELRKTLRDYRIGLKKATHELKKATHELKKTTRIIESNEPLPRIKNKERDEIMKIH